jgi:hypothetical protein
MLLSIPTYLVLLFGAITLVTLLLFLDAVRKAGWTGWKIPALLIGWLAFQAALTLNGFYYINPSEFPPRFPVLILFPFLVILLLFTTSKGRKFIDSLPLEKLTMLHIVRIPVELTLFGLFLHHAVPELMTFEGRNPDILSGLTAPIVYLLFFRKGKINQTGLLIWNLACLGLLINIVINAIFSAPFAFQKQAFDQPNIAVLFFPFSWLPSFVVPVVLFCHLASIRQLITNKSSIVVS